MKLTTMKLIVLCLILTLLPLNVMAKKADDTKNASFPGTTYLEMPLDNYGGSTVDSSIQITDIKINNHQLSLDAYISYNQKTYTLRHLVERYSKLV